MQNILIGILVVILGFFGVNTGAEVLHNNEKEAADAAQKKAQKIALKRAKKNEDVEKQAKDQAENLIENLISGVADGKQIAFNW